MEASRAQARARAQGNLYEDSDSDDEAANENGNNDLKNRVWLPTDFWEYVDHVLRELRHEARRAENTLAGRSKYLEMYVLIPARILHISPFSKVFHPLLASRHEDIPRYCLKPPHSRIRPSHRSMAKGHS